MVDWHVRPYEQRDEEQLAELFTRVFGHSRTIEARRWKLRERVAPFDTLWVAATEDGRIVGQYAGIPLRLKLGDQIHPAIQSVEAMTTPEWRRKGIITALVSEAHRVWQLAGQVGVLGLPNEQWGRRASAMGYTALFPLAWLRYPLHLDRVATRTGRVPGALRGPARLLGEAVSYVWRRRYELPIEEVDVQLEEVTAPCSAIDQLWSEASKLRKNMVVRDSAWVEWRYLRAVGMGYTVLLARVAGTPIGYIAYRVTGSGQAINGYIADLFVPSWSVSIVGSLLSLAFRDMSSMNAGMVISAVAKDSALYQQLRSFGFVRGGAQFGFEMVSLQPGLDLQCLTDPGLWHLTGGDFDVDLA